MPAVRTVPRDVLIRVPKVEPYSNSYLSPSARAKEEAKKLAAAAVPVGTTDGGAVEAPTLTVDSLNTTIPTASTAEGNSEPAPTEGRQRGNSPTLPFLSVDREEERTVELSKAATSSAGWNSLLVWARRQRGAQWDESTALWQVDKGSREYYSFCQHPATTDRNNQPGTTTTTTAAPAESVVVGEEDEDKGPTRVARNKTDGGDGSPPPVSSGRTIRLLRR